MVAMSLVDSVFSDNPSAERSLRIAGQLVQSALSDLAQIEKLDDSLAPEDPLRFDRRTAALLREEYERWATNAALLLERVDLFTDRGDLVLSVEALHHAYGKTRARLSVSIDDMEASIDALAHGKLIPMEEVRRGLL